MKRVGLVLLLLVIGLGTAMAQAPVGDNSVYWVTYFSNANTKAAPDGTLRLINDGTQATSCPDGNCNGTLWADIYVFDDSEEMISCCSCAITSDGLLSESVNYQLDYPLGPNAQSQAANGIVPPALGSTFSLRGEFTRGVIKVVASSNNNPTTPTPTPGLRGWMTHIQATSVTIKIPAYGVVTTTENGPFSWVTETPLSDSNLSGAEQANLGAVCSYGLQDNSGYGYCGCTPEDVDF